MVAHEELKIQMYRLYTIVFLSFLYQNFMIHVTKTVIKTIRWKDGLNRIESADSAILLLAPTFFSLRILQKWLIALITGVIAFVP